MFNSHLIPTILQLGVNKFAGSVKVPIIIKTNFVEARTHKKTDGPSL